MTREMKDSGIEWIGKIPVHWNTHRISSYFSERKNKNLSCTETNLLSLSYGKIIRKDINTNGGLLPVSFSTYNIVEPLDIIIRPTDLQNDKKSLRTGLSHEHGIITSAYITLAPKKTVNPKYFHYLLHTYDIEKVFYNMGNGVRQGLNYNEFAKLLVIEPLFAEQRLIANFLDSKCSEIDSLTDDITKEIELLKEYRKSVIYEAVTKGLDSNVEMKDSGIEWIGKIPVYWEVVRMKDLGRTRNGLTYKPSDMTDESGVLVLRSSNIQNGQLSLKDNVYVAMNPSKELMVKEGDILICSRNGSRELIGKNILIGSSIVASFGAFMMIFRSPYNSSYIYYLLNSDIFSYYLGTFLTSTINQLTGRNFDNMKIPYSYDKDEQRKIVCYLNTKCSEIDSIIASKQEQIDTLKEYKKSLIYEYVTGKKEVPAV